VTFAQFSPDSGIELNSPAPELDCRAVVLGPVRLTSLRGVLPRLLVVARSDARACRTSPWLWQVGRKAQVVASRTPGLVGQ